MVFLELIVDKKLGESEFGSENRFYDIYSDADVFHIVDQLGNGKPVIFNGGGVYAFVAANKEGLLRIGEDKGRSMLERPPVMAAEWDMVKPIVDWSNLKGKFDEKVLKQFFFKLHYTLPAVVIFPVIEEKARELLTQTLGADWAKRMIWKDKRVSTCAIDTLAYPGVNTLVHNAREQGFDAVYFTSANKPGEPTISNLKEVQKVFPGITVIE